MTRTLEDELLIACSRLQFDEMYRDRVVAACARGQVDWDLVYRAAVGHKIAPLVFKNLSACSAVIDSLPRDVADKFRNELRLHAVKKAIARTLITEMAEFFAGRSHDLLLLKHAAFCARLRGLFDVTMSDDVDVVARPKGESVERDDDRYVYKLRPWLLSDKLQRAFRRFSRDDLDPTSAVIREFWTSHDFSRRPVGLELENRVHHDVVWGGCVAIDLRRVWADAKLDQVDGRPVFVPDDHDLIIMNAVNIHRKPRLRLRNLIEIHELIGDVLDWDIFTRKVQAYRCNSLVYSALHATRAVLESQVPGCVLTALAPGTTKRRAFAFIDERISPSTVCRSRDGGTNARGRRGRVGDVARRALALSGPQFIRFIWLRLVLHRLLGVLKW